MSTVARSATRRHPARRRLAGLVLAAATSLTVVGCGASTSGPEPIARPRHTSPTAASTTQIPAAAGRPSAAPGSAEVVRTDHALEAHAEPAATSARHTLPATTELGSPTALLVTARTAGWVQVLVPGRPTGATAWLATDGLDVRPVTIEVRVDLAARTLSVVDGGRTLLTTPAAVGAPATPTPVGRFSVTDKLDTQDPGGAYGRYAFGLSGRSAVLTEFAGGDGQIGIHGTDDPGSIGRPVSHGCIRVPNEVMARLTAILPLGTPVVVG